MKKIELRAKQYAKKYIENNFNGTETAQQLYDVKNRKVAQSIATENLSKPVFQDAIREAMEESGLKREVRHRLLERNAKQAKNYSASNQAIEIATKIAGDFAPERKITANIDITNPEQLREEVKAIIDELKALDVPNP